jgi:hypothetical protein
MVSHELLPYCTQRFVHGRDLREDVGTVPILLDHLLKTTHLPLNAPKPLKITLFAIRVHAHCLPIRGFCQASLLHAATLAVYPACSTARMRSATE